MIYNITPKDIKTLVCGAIGGALAGMIVTGSAFGEYFLELQTGDIQDRGRTERITSSTLFYPIELNTQTNYV